LGVRWLDCSRKDVKRERQQCPKKVHLESADQACVNKRARREM